MNGVLNMYKYIHVLRVEVSNSVRCRLIFFLIPSTLCAYLLALSAAELANLGEQAARVWVCFFGAEGV